MNEYHIRPEQIGGRQLLYDAVGSVVVAHRDVEGNCARADVPAELDFFVEKFRRNRLGLLRRRSDEHAIAARSAFGHASQIIVSPSRSGLLRKRMMPGIDEEPVAVDPANAGVVEASEKLVRVIWRIHQMAVIYDCRDASVDRLKRAEKVSQIGVLRRVKGGINRAHPNDVVEQAPVRGNGPELCLPNVPVCIHEPRHYDHASGVNKLRSWRSRSVFA